MQNDIHDMVVQGHMGTEQLHANIQVVTTYVTGIYQVIHAKGNMEYRSKSNTNHRGSGVGQPAYNFILLTKMGS